MGLKKLGMLIGAVVAAVTMAAAPASAATPPYPPTGATLILSTTVVTPGGTFTATLVGCSLGETVNFTLDGATVQASCNGSAGSYRLPTATGEPSATATLTAPTAPGTYQIVATGLTSGASATATITVAAATGGGEIPQTGSDASMPTAQIAGGLVVVGAGLAGVAGIRRRKSAQAA